MTEQEALQKIADPKWRLSHLYKIKTKTQKLVTFKPNRMQQMYLARKTLRDIILKARQLGMTTLKLLELLDYTISNENTNSVVIAHLRDKTAVLFEIVRLAFQHLPEPLRPKVSYDNRNELYFPEINSKIVVAVDTRGESVHNLHVSELAFMQDAEKKMLGILESVPKHAPISFESTANGMSGYFFDTYEDEKNEFTKHFYNWTLADEYQEPTLKTIEQLREEYAPLQIKYNLIEDIDERFDLTPEQFQWYINKVIRHKHHVVQEYPTTALEAFISSGRNLFSVVDLQKHQVEFPIGRKWEDMLIWQEPMEGFRYVIGVDPSEGTGNDNSVIEVLNAYTGEQVAEFASNSVKPDILGDYVLEIAKYYNNALIVPEINGIAGGMLLNSIKARYQNIYRRQTFDKITKEESDALGWKTNGTTKPLMVMELEHRVREESIKIVSEDAIREMRTFVQSDEPGTNGFAAEGANKDDRVMALALAVQGLKNVPKQKAPKTIAQLKLEEYIKRHGLPKEFQEDRPEDNVNHRYRPNQGLRKRRYM